MEQPKILRITTVPLSLYILLKGQMKFMSDNGFNVIMVSSDGEQISDVINNEQCQHVIVHMTRSISPFSDLRSIFSLIKLIRKVKPAIVHTHTPKAGLLGMIAAKICLVPVRLHTIAGLPVMTAKGLTKSLLIFAEKLTYWSSHRILVNSEGIKNYMINHSLINSSKLDMIGVGSSNGIDLNRYCIENLDSKILDRAKRDIKYDEGKFYFVSIGRVVKDKGIVELIEAFKAISKSNPEVVLLLLGPFESVRKSENIPSGVIDFIKQSKKIIHIDWTEHVEYFLHLADTLIHASYREGFPNVLLQAGAMGCPIICSGIPGNSDLVVHKKRGLIFEVADVESLLESMVYALENTEELKTYSKELLRYVQINFDRQKFHQSLLGYYKSKL